MEWLIDCFHTCIISIPAPLFKREGMLLRVSCIFVSDGVKTELQGEDGARSGALGLAGGAACLRKLQFYEYRGKQNLYITAKKNLLQKFACSCFPA